MRGLPDAGTLGALVAGTHDDEDRPAWEALVTQPGGAEAWGGAVARRHRLDTLASAVRGRAWLARALGEVSALSRRFRSKPAFALQLAFPDAHLDALAGAALGPSDGAFVDDKIELRWGQIVTVRLRVGDRIALPVVTDQTPVEVRYLSQGRDGSLPGRAWHLEPGEAPVLLVALIGAEAESTLSEALTQATAAAGVLLLEAASMGATSA